MDFLHEGIPQPTCHAEWHGDGEASQKSQKSQKSQTPIPNSSSPNPDIGDMLLALLAHPNIASKHWIIRQYDHEVQGGSVVKPLVGVKSDGPSDAAVLRPKLDTDKAIALSNGLATMLDRKSVV